MDAHSDAAESGSETLLHLKYKTQYRVPRSNLVNQVHQQPRRICDNKGTLRVRLDISSYSLWEATKYYNNPLPAKVLTLVRVMLLEMSHLIWWSHTKT